VKKILFENRALHSIHPSGVGRYARCLFQELQKKNRDTIYPSSVLFAEKFSTSFTRAYEIP